MASDMNNVLKTIYDFSVKDIVGNDFKLANFKGSVMLIVNTASKCGFTPQYKELESLYEKYKDKGFTVIGFPCNQFANQEPGSTEGIQCFIRDNYHVSFPMMDKIDVNGIHEHPIYTYLKDQQRGFLSKKIKWNFTKFLVDRNGIPVKRYSPSTNPMSIEQDILNLLSQDNPFKGV
ncbi:hypothetical protein WA158_008170 [Blastocystis sp. Blastoise]